MIQQEATTIGRRENCKYVIGFDEDACRNHRTDQMVQIRKVKRREKLDTKRTVQKSTSTPKENVSFSVDLIERMSGYIVGVVRGSDAHSSYVWTKDTQKELLGCLSYFRLLFDTDIKDPSPFDLFLSMGGLLAAVLRLIVRCDVPKIQHLASNLLVMISSSTNAYCDHLVSARVPEAVVDLLCLHSTSRICLSPAVVFPSSADAQAAHALGGSANTACRPLSDVVRQNLYLIAGNLLAGSTASRNALINCTPQSLLYGASEHSSEGKEWRFALGKGCFLLPLLSVMCVLEEGAFIPSLRDQDQDQDRGTNATGACGNVISIANSDSPSLNSVHSITWMLKSAFQPYSDESSQKGQVRWVPSSLLTPLVKLSLILLQTMDNELLVTALGFTRGMLSYVSGGAKESNHLQDVIAQLFEGGLISQLFLILKRPARHSTSSSTGVPMDSNDMDIAVVSAVAIPQHTVTFRQLQQQITALLCHVLLVVFPSTANDVLMMGAASTLYMHVALWRFDIIPQLLASLLYDFLEIKRREDVYKVLATIVRSHGVLRTDLICTFFYGQAFPPPIGNSVNLTTISIVVCSIGSFDLKLRSINLLCLLIEYATTTSASTSFPVLFPTFLHLYTSVIVPVDYALRMCCGDVSGSQCVDLTTCTLLLHAVSALSSRITSLLQSNSTWCDSTNTHIPMSLNNGTIHHPIMWEDVVAGWLEVVSPLVFLPYECHNDITMVASRLVHTFESFVLDDS